MLYTTSPVRSQDALDVNGFRLTPGPQRLAAIDHLRAISILLMILAHFGPGTLQRLPFTVEYMDSILFYGRFATIMFILVFGITVGFVHYPRFHSRDRAKTVSRIYARTRLVIICAIAI